jgi:LEA14-like dessication related protein
MKKPLILLLLLAAAAYAGFVIARQVSLLKKTCIKIVSYTLSGVLTKQASLSVMLQITNNSDIDLQAKNGNFDIYLNNVFISKVQVPITQALNKHQTIQLPLTAYFNPGTVITQGLQSLLSNPSNVRLTIKGKVSVMSSIIAINNLKIEETILLQDILKPSSSNKKC